MYTYRATVLRVIDGDTFDFDVDLGFRVRMGLRVRLAGVDAPEIRGADRDRGHIARQFVEHLMGPGSTVTIRTEKDRRSFDRWIAHVTLADGTDLAQRLRDEGLAK
jgi:micrococcal nuclease